MIISSKDHLDRMEKTTSCPSLIDQILKSDVKELPHILNGNLKWERDQDDLFHWIAVLNKIDEILEDQIKKYELNDECTKLQEISNEDQVLITSCLYFLAVLLENCSNTGLFSSCDRVDSLINSPSIEVRLAALEVAYNIGKCSIEKGSSKLTPPKDMKLKMLKIAKSYPPLPIGELNRKQGAIKSSKAKDTKELYHYTLLESLNPQDDCPEKWKQLDFHYYRNSRLTTPSKPNTLGKSFNSLKSKNEQNSKVLENNVKTSEGVTTFHLSKETIKKLTLQQIYDKGADTLPKKLHFELSLSAMVAKAFNQNSFDSFKLREKLVISKCLAVAYICCSSSNEFAASRYFEWDPYIFSYLGDLISPENSSTVSKAVQNAAIMSLEAMSLKKVWCGDIVRCMGGNVNHGILFQVLRHIFSIVSQNTQNDYDTEKSFVRYFKMIDNLLNSKSFTSNLVFGGILRELLKFFRGSGNYAWTCTAAMKTLEVFLNTSSDYISEFADNNGFQILIKTIGSRVESSSRTYSGDAQINFRDGNYIRSLFTIAYVCIQSDLGDRLRNLFDSPILQSFNIVLLNPRFFGPSILTSVIDCVFYIIHNEPTAFSILQEAKVIDNILDNFGNFFFASSELLMSLPEVIGAICLNKEGVKKVLEKKAIPEFFKIFHVVEFAKELIISNTATSVGSSFDELARHHSDLKPIILQELSNLIQFSPISPDKVDEGSIGVRYFKSDLGSMYLSSSEDPMLNEPNAESLPSWDNTSTSYIADNLFFFLSGLLEDSGQWNLDLPSTIPFEHWKKFVSLNNVSVDYVSSNGYCTLIDILKYHDEETKDYFLPSLVKYLDASLQSERIQNYIKFQDTSVSYFDRFSEDPESGSSFLMELNLLNNILFPITEMLNFSSQVFSFVTEMDNSNQLNFRLLNNLGKLLRRNILEDIIVRSRLPTEVGKLTEATLLESNNPPLRVYVNAPNPKSKRYEGTSAKFKNTVQIRSILHKYQKLTSSLFYLLVKLSVPLRDCQFDVKGQRQAIELTLQIANIFKEITTLHSQNSLIDANYLLVVVNICFFCLSSRERLNNDSIHISFGITLLQVDYICLLKDIAINSWNLLLTLDVKEVERTSSLKYIEFSQPSIIKNLLSQIFMIFAKLVNVDSVPDLYAADQCYHDGYAGDPDVSLIPSFLVECRSVAIDLLVNLIGSQSRLYRESSVSFSNIPSPLIDQTIFISKNIWMAKKESTNTKFIPLDPNNVFPPKKQVDFLVSKGLSEEQASNFFKYFHNIYDLDEKNIEDCKDIIPDLTFWKNIIHDVSLEKPDFSIMNYTPKGPSLSDKRSSESVNFSKTWFNIACLYDGCVDGIAEMLLLTYADLGSLVRELFTLILDKNNQGIKSYTGQLMHLLSIIVRDATAAGSSGDFFKEFTFYMLSIMKNDADCISKPHFSHGLYILEQVLSFKCFPVIENSDVKMSIANTPVPYTINHDLYDEIFQQFQNLAGINDINLALNIAKCLVLYASGTEYRVKLLKSPLLLHLISLSNMFIQERTKGFELYQTVILILIRRCYETDDLVRSIINNGISDVFKSNFRVRYDFSSVLKETVPLSVRSPKMLVDALSQEIRIDNFDESKTISSKTPILHIKPQISNEETKFEASSGLSHESKKDDINPKGLMFYLISELMKACKQDLFTDPESANELECESEKLDSNSNFNNRNFAYVCFLLQVIVETVGSYKCAKLEFLIYSKNGSSMDFRPRFTAINFLMHQLIPVQATDETSHSEIERMNTLSSMSKMVVLALVSSVPPIDGSNVELKKEDVDMAYIRKFFAEAFSKALSDIEASNIAPEKKYNKIQGILDLCSSVLSQKFRESAGPIFNKSSTKYDSYFISKALLEGQIPSTISTSLSRVDINYPSIDKFIKLSLKPLSLLGKLVQEQPEYFNEGHQDEANEDDILPDDVEDDKDDSTEMFRNSTLGMYDIDYATQDEEDYYDDGDNLEVLISEGVSDENIDSFDDTTDDSDVDSVNEDISMNEDFDAHQEQAFTDDHDELIEEISMSSLSDEYSENESEDYGDESVLYDYEDESEEYDSEELEGWIEAFEDDVSQADVDINAGEEEELDPLRRPNGESRDIYDINEAASEDEFEDDEDNDSGIQVIEEVSGFGPTSTSRRRAREFANSFFDALRPTMGENNVASFLDGLFSNNGGLFGSNGIIRAYSLNRNGRIERNFGGSIRLGASSHSGFNSLTNMMIKSTYERWNDVVTLFFSKNKEAFTLKLIPSIVNRIKDASIELHKKKKEESEKLKKEKEERIHKQQEEERIRREEREIRRLNSVDEGTTNHSSSSEPVIVHIGNREVDIRGTDIDPEFFEALPDDMREEVLTQHIRERRADAVNNGTDAREIDPDFLDALPLQIREEILQQESTTRSFTMQNDFSFEEPDIGDEISQYDIESNDRDQISNLLTTGESGATGSSGPTDKKAVIKSTFSVPLVDKIGVASITRLLFVPQSINHREHIHSALSYICYNKKTRSEVIGTLVAILNEIFINHRSLEKVFTQVTLKSNGGAPGSKHVSVTPAGSSIIIIGTQIIEAIHYLLENDKLMRYYILTELDNLKLFKKSGPKHKQLNKEQRYPINILLRLLDNRAVSEEQTMVDILTRVLQISTRPIYVFQEAKSKTQNSVPPPFSIPSIPEYNVRQIIKVLISNDCPNITFKRAITTMQNLSSIPKLQQTLSKELSDKATIFGNSIIEDLKQLTKNIESSNDPDFETIIYSNFNASGSNQAKLLRILTALDYMFESKIHNDEVASTNEARPYDEVEELTEIYNKLSLGSLWDALSDCLRVIESKSLTAMATILLPLIESLMVVCKHSKVKELQTKDLIKYEARKIDFAKEPIESLFFSFTDEHKKILNQMVRSNTNLMSGPFSMLVRNSGVLEFDNKKNYFDRKLHEGEEEKPKLSLSIRRDQVFLDTYRSLFFRSKDEFRNSKLEVTFKGEAGVDAGGVTREWYQVLSRQMFNPDYALFIPVASDETTFHPNRTSYVNPEHLLFFKFIGKIIGKAIYDGCFLDCHFSRAVYKGLLEKPVSLKDMETLDLEYFKSLLWILENDVTDVITEDFSVETDDYGEHKIIDLIPNGRNISVTEENKYEFVRLVVEYRLQTSVAEQMDNFLQGFYEIIPKDLVSIFNEQELELLISGLPDINVQDWQNNTTYNNYSPSSEQIQWFWRAVKSFDNEERAKLLQFATGTSKVPLNGFKELSGANGTSKFSIHRDYGSKERLPSSHTCFNQIDLPAYDSYETLRGSLLLAISEGYQGFGLA